MIHKQVPVSRAKAEGEGRFSALAAVFDVVDRVGDRMMPGSFTETLRKWRESGKRLPVVWSHKTDTPDTIIGSADPNDVRETTSGLQVDGVLDIEESSVARRAWQLLKSGAVSGWSFGYIVKDQKRDRQGVNEVFAVDLLELGPTLSPANPQTATLGVKEFAHPDAPRTERKVGMTDEELDKLFGEFRTKAKAPIEVVSFKC